MLSKGEQGYLRANGNVIAFTLNTWQYAQLTTDNELSLLFLDALFSCVSDDRNVTRKVLNGVWAAVRSLKKVEFAGFGVEFGGDGNGGGQVGLDVLKANFAEQVKKRLENTGCDRVVVFIDDLDRILPMRAVEILESLKNFVDVEGTVFVIACDYEVVRKGLKAKFDVSEDDLEGRSFFDKIIQVPFRMPIHGYEVQRYVAGMLTRIGWSFDEEDLQTYQTLLEYSIGFNPRSVKRLCNTMLLLKRVAIGAVVEGGESVLSHRVPFLVLFGLGCLEASYERVYSALYQIEDDEQLAQLLMNPNQGLEDIRALDYIEDEGQRAEVTEKVVQLLKVLGDAIDIDRNGELDEQELEQLRTVMTLSAITSAANERRGKRAPARSASELLSFVENEEEQEILSSFQEFFHVRSEKSGIRERTTRTLISYDVSRLKWLKSGRGWQPVVQLSPMGGDGITVSLGMKALRKLNGTPARREARDALTAFVEAHTDADSKKGQLWKLSVKSKDQGERLLGLLENVRPFA